MLVERSLSILSYLAEHAGVHGVRQISRSLNIAPSTTHRILDTLTSLGYARSRDNSGQYEIGPRAVQLGASAMRSFDLTSVAPRTLLALSQETGEATFLAILEDGEVLYLLKEESSYAIHTDVRLGSKRPVHSTALGKALLSALPELAVADIVDRRGLQGFTSSTITNPAELRTELALIREIGYSVDREELEAGLMCIAAVVRDHRREPAGAISLAGPIARVAPMEVALASKVRQAAREISESMGFPVGGAVESFSSGG